MSNDVDYVELICDTQKFNIFNEKYSESLEELCYDKGDELMMSFDYCIKKYIPASVC